MSHWGIIQLVFIGSYQMYSMFCQVRQFSLLPKKKKHILVEII